MIRTFLFILVCFWHVLSFSQNNRWFALDSPYDLIWLSNPVLLDINGDGINEFDDLDSKWSANYFLVENINFHADSSKVDWNGDGVINDLDQAGLSVIGTELNPFSGKFNANYHSIVNLYKTGSDSRNGLFGTIKGAVIENLKLENIKFYSNKEYNGGIVGRADLELAPGDSNIVRRCMVAGHFYLSSVDNNLYSGGIIGRTNNAKIVECASFVSMFAVGDSTRNRRVGGIVGQIEGTASIINCYSISTVSAFAQSSLLVARSFADELVKIQNCYAAGDLFSTAIPSSANLGIFAGLIAAPDISSCYFDNTSNIFPGVGVSDASVDVLGLSEMSFSLEESFKDWDFTNTWQIKEIDGVLRPRLKWENMLDAPPESIDLTGSIPYYGPVLRWENSKTPVHVPVIHNDEFMLYPNPSDQYIIVDMGDNSGEISILNLSGQRIKIMKLPSGENRINTTELKPGLYFIRKEGAVAKFIKN